MKAKRGDMVVFDSGDKKDLRGIVLEISMGMVNIMAESGSYQIRLNEIKENNGSVFEKEWK